MPGVTITISSPVLVAGQISATTDAGGVYRFPSLSPGTYAVKLELSGFQTVTRENIAVLVGQTTPVDLAMKVASVAETVTVTGASPTVDTTSANVSVNLSEQLIQGTPGGRDIWALVEAKVPGLRDEPAGRRRHLGRPAGHLQRARHDERAEHVVPERRQRRRSGGDRRGGLLLRLRRVRRHPGVDRRARHHGADLRRVPEHDHEDRRQQVARRRDVHVDRRQRCRAATITTRPAEVRVPAGRQHVGLRLGHQRTAGGPLVAEQAAVLRLVPRLARAPERAGAELAVGARPDQHHLGSGQRHLAGRTRTTSSPASTRGSATASRTGC